MVLLMLMAILYAGVAFIGFFKAGNQSAAWAAGKSEPVRALWVQVGILLFYLLCMMHAILMMWYQSIDPSICILMIALLWFLNKRLFKTTMIRKMK